MRHRVGSSEACWKPQNIAAPPLTRLAILTVLFNQRRWSSMSNTVVDRLVTMQQARGLKGSAIPCTMLNILWGHTALTPILVESTAIFSWFDVWCAAWSWQHMMIQIQHQWLSSPSWTILCYNSKICYAHRPRYNVWKAWECSYCWRDCACRQTNNEGCTIPPIGGKSSASFDPDGVQFPLRPLHSWHHIALSDSVDF